MRSRAEVTKRYPFYAEVPLEWNANLEFRAKIADEGARDAGARRDYLAMAAKDLLFFTSTFLWTYNPRLKHGNRILPLIPWQFQESFLWEIEEAIDEGYGLFCDKSRYMGASWSILVPFLHKLRFEDYSTFLLMSRNEDFVDKSEDPKSLFWKLDFMRRHLPNWMQPDPDDERFGWSRKFKHIGNLVNNTTADGEATTGEAGAGDRRSAQLLDEFAKFTPADQTKVIASSSATTDCHIYNSTPDGENTEFHGLSQNADIRRVRLHWSIHPVFSKGLYTSENGLLRILDTEFRGMVKHTYSQPAVLFPDNYPFILDGMLRSPFYDAEARKLRHPKLVAQELDCDYSGSGWKLYDGSRLDIVNNRDTREPLFTADIQYERKAERWGDYAGARLVLRDGGPIKLWFNPTADGRLPAGLEAVCAADIGYGSGSSNSCFAAANLDTREKILEYTDPNVKMTDFGRQSLALCAALTGRVPPMFLFENTTVATTYTETIVDADYPRIWRQLVKLDTKKKERSEKIGWFPSPAAKLALLLEYGDAIFEGKFCERSKDTVAECREFIIGRTKKTNKLTAIHSKEAATEDPTGAGDAHGDRVITSGMLWLGCRDTKPTIAKPVERFRWTFAERRKIRLAKGEDSDL